MGKDEKKLKGEGGACAVGKKGLPLQANNTNNKVEKFGCLQPPKKMLKLRNNHCYIISQPT